jgi:D-lactate dehydrogenase
VSTARLVRPVEFTSVAEAIELAWHVREGLLGLVGKNRPEGSTLITEDVCFPPERLAQGAHDVQELLAKHGFTPGVAGTRLTATFTSRSSRISVTPRDGPGTRIS